MAIPKELSSSGSRHPIHSSSRPARPRRSRQASSFSPSGGRENAHASDAAMHKRDLCSASHIVVSRCDDDGEEDIAAVSSRSSNAQLTMLSQSHAKVVGRARGEGDGVFFRADSSPPVPPARRALRHVPRARIERDVEAAMP